MWGLGVLISTLVAKFLLAQGAEARQLPLQPQQEPRWNWTAAPNEDETGHLVFNSLAGMLQHWSNSYWRNGHTIILGNIASGTLLYHGTRRVDVDGPPPSADWVSLDVDHAAPFGHRLFTFAVEAESFRVLYFDGSSAAKVDSGTIDTQELVLHDNVTPGHQWKTEWIWIKELCEAFGPYGIKGFVRMEYDFEVMICDFMDGLHLVSQIDIVPYNNTVVGPPSVPEERPWPGPPRGWKGSTRPNTSIDLEAIQAGAWHNFSPGLPGVKLDFATFISFFDSKYTSLTAARRGVPRQHFRPGNASLVDVRLFQNDDLHQALLRPPFSGSGIDWRDVSLSVTNRFTGRPEFLSWLLRSNLTRFGDIPLRKRLFVARNSVLTLLTPYMANNTVPTSDSADWLGPTIERCATVFTAELDESSMAPPELLLKNAVLTVSREVCRTMGIIWLDAFAAEEQPEERQTELMDNWAREVDRLMD